MISGIEAQESGGVTILLDRFIRGDEARIFYKPYYRREDFDDERYRPTFTPLAYPGQVLTIRGRIKKMSGQRIGITPYVRDAGTGEIFNAGYTFPEPDSPFFIEWTLPEVPFAVAEAGLMVMNFDAQKFLGELILDEYSITGKRSGRVVFGDETEEFEGLSRCSAVGGAWSVTGGALEVITRDKFLLFTGPYYTRDSRVALKLIPDYGTSHLVAFRSGGAERGYFFGFHGDGRAVLMKRDGSETILADTEFHWEPGREYELGAEVNDQGSAARIVCNIDGKRVLEFQDSDPYASGMAGAGKIEGGRTRFLEISFEEL